MGAHPGWWLFGAGAVLMVIGLLWAWGFSVPWLGRLPGDIAIRGEHGSFYFPMTTCILISVALTALSWLIRRFSS